MPARLSLRFQESVIREVVLNEGVVSIGRQPDCLLRIDNPIVSGHHATIYWENGHYVVEDNESFNGTYLNNRRISRAELRDGDVVLIGKHTVEFRTAAGNHDACISPAAKEPVAKDRSRRTQARVEGAKPPQLEATMVLDSSRVKEMLAKMARGPEAVGVSCAAMPALERRGVTRTRQIGTVTIVAGRTNHQHYVLSSKLSVIGKSPMASIRLKRWFAPRIAASIHQREEGYFLVAAGKNIRIKVNDAEVTNGQQELKGGDQFEVAGIIARFGYEKG